MGTALVKGGNAPLPGSGSGPAAVVVGLGWDLPTGAREPLQLDALALLVDARGRVLSDAHVVFFGCPRSADGSVRHRGIDLSGEGEGDDERIEVDLGAVPAQAVRVVFPVAIHDAVRRRQSFGQVRHAYVRVVERPSGRELVRYDLGRDASVETAMIFAELYRAGSGWKFRAVGQGYATGLRGIADDYGVHVG